MALSAPNELTQEQVATILTKPLEQKSIFLESGPHIFDTHGPLRVPKLPGDGSGTLEWVGQNEPIPEHDPEFGETQLLPDTMKSLKVITRYSNELARQTVISLDAALKARLVLDVANKLDAQLLGAGGDGTTTPQGMFAWAGTQEVTAAAAQLSGDLLLDAFGLALAKNVDTDRVALFIRPEDYMVMRKAKDADGRYLVAPDVSGTGLTVPLLGVKAKVSSRIPEGSAAIADMSQVAVARDLAPTVKILTERYADYDQQAIRVVARYDAKPLNPEAIIKITGLGAAE